MLIVALAGCGGGSGGPRITPTPTASSTPTPTTTPTTAPVFNTRRTINLVPFRDPWRSARERFLDIDDRPFSAAFKRDFRYQTGQITLEYQTAPDAPYFVGRLSARGLKPNFGYQIKLAGKPQNGSRGWGALGDDRANQAIGESARWWNDSLQRNTSDSSVAANNARSPEARDSIYGYHYIGDFITNAQGNADVEVVGQSSYHIIWQDKQQTSLKQEEFGTFSIGSEAAPFYGYDQFTPTISVKLWYEFEANRARQVRLPPGDYNCRFLLTEDTFHAPDAEVGGLWKTVLASEDFGADGKPDSDSSNDVRFVIR